MAPDLTFPPVGNWQAMLTEKVLSMRSRFSLLATLWLVLAPLSSPVTASNPPLPVTADRIVDVAVASGLIARTDFESIRDLHVGPLLVGRPAATDDPARTFSIIVFESDEGPIQIQFIMAAPWGGLEERLELAGAIAAELVTLPSALPPLPPVEAGMGALSHMASWLYSLFYESWLGWPGSERRLVRVRDGMAIILEGTPPETWSMTLAVDRGYPDATWPGQWPDADPPAVTQARQLIRQGEYRAAHDLLLPLAKAGNPPAALLMGDMVRFGRLDVPHIESATDWYLVAGRYRHPVAIWSLAAILAEGWGAFFISNLKGQLLAGAQAAGSADALHVLGRTPPGVNYVRPEGVTAADQILQAARWGLLAAQHDIASRYAEGDGVAVNPVEAFAWALVAMGNTGPGADYIFSRQLLDSLGKELDAAEIAEARERASSLVTGPPAWPPPDIIVPDPG